MFFCVLYSTRLKTCQDGDSTVGAGGKRNTKRSCLQCECSSRCQHKSLPKQEYNMGIIVCSIAGSHLAKAPQQSAKQTREPLDKQGALILPHPHISSAKSLSFISFTETLLIQEPPSPASITHPHATRNDTDFAHTLDSDGTLHCQKSVHFLRYPPKKVPGLGGKIYT